MSSESTPPRRRLWRVFYVLLGILAVVIITRVGLGWGLDREPIWAEDGYPATLEELEASYTLPEGAPNAADLYQQAFDLGLGAVGYDAAYEALDAAADGEPLPEEPLAVLEDYLTQHQECVDLLYEAAQVEHCRFPLDFMDRNVSIPDHYSLMRQTARFLQIEAWYAAAVGNGARATRALHAMLGACRALHQEPTGIAYLVALALDGMTFSTLKIVLEYDCLDDALLASLNGPIKELEDIASLRRALVGHSIVETALAPDIAIVREEHILNTLARAAGVHLVAIQKIMSAHEDVYRLSKEATSSILETSRRVELSSSGEMAPLLTNGALLLKKEQYMYSPLLWLRAHLRYAAQAQAARAAIAVMRHRLAHGVLPQTLADIDPAFWPEDMDDPFTGEPLHYRQTNNGFMVYSVGENGKDDGGSTERVERTPHDIVLQVDLLSRQ
jgi:hypothetical protein